MTVRPRLAITLGDAAGIGPEVIAKALPREVDLGRSIPVVIGDARVVEQELERHAPGWKVVRVDLPETFETRAGTLPVLDLANSDPSRVAVGKVDAYTGQAAYECVVTAAELAISEKVDGIVTAPLNKEAMHLAGRRFDGHTGLLGHLTGAENYFMVLASDRLSVIHVSTHVSVAEAVKRVTAGRVTACIRAGDAHLRELGNDAPRIAVCGLNPHAGENRLFGAEDEDEIRPAVEEATAGGIDARGPLPADACIRQAYDGEYDLVVVMFHDQGHVPLKLIAFAEGVNVTVGLPIIRKSVDHGTAFDIAYHGVADPTNMTTAIDYAYRWTMGRIGATG